MRYLGVQIPVLINDAVRVNFDELFKSVSIHFSKWNKQGYSWFEQVSLVKSFILPKFLFLFCTLPVKMPQKKLQLCKGLLISSSGLAVDLESGFRHYIRPQI